MTNPETPVAPAKGKWLKRLIGLGCLLLILLVIIAIRLPTIQVEGALASQDAAIVSLREIQAAAGSYFHSYSNGFPPTLGMLGSGDAAANCNQARLLPSDLADGEHGYYRFTYQPGPIVENPTSGCSPGVTNYTVAAQPIEYRNPAGISFIIEETRAIHFTREDRAATMDDPLFAGSENEFSAEESLLDIFAAQTAYSQTIGEGNYATNLIALVEAQLIDPDLSSGTRQGYRFELAGSEDSTGWMASFTVMARPLEYRWVQRSYYGDESGVIRFTTKDRSATAEDPPL